MKVQLKKIISSPTENIFFIGLFFILTIFPYQLCVNMSILTRDIALIAIPRDIGLAPLICFLLENFYGKKGKKRKKCPLGHKTDGESELYPYMEYCPRCHVWYSKNRLK